MTQTYARVPVWPLFGGIIVLFVSFAPAQTFSSAGGMAERMNGYFADLQAEFDRIATAKAANSMRLRTIDWHFVKSLKANQPIYSLIKANSKGAVISEVIRGEKPERKKRSVADQAWFRKLAGGGENHVDFIKDEETQRYYLLWARASLSPRTRKFTGAIIAKIDLWDCFHKISAGFEEPFLIKIGSLSLYSHKWEKEAGYADEELAVPGLKNVRVLHAKTAAVQNVPDSLAAAQQAALAAQASVKAPASPEKQAKMKKLRKIVIIYWIVVLVLLAFAAFRLIVWIQHKMLQRKIDREDII
jgi:hypothetical protein